MIDADEALAVQPQAFWTCGRRYSHGRRSPVECELGGCRGTCASQYRNPASVRPLRNGAVGALQRFFTHGPRDGLQRSRRAPDPAPPSPHLPPPGPTGAGETKTTAPNIAIPDMDPAGINSVLNISTVGTVATLSVSVDIQHQWVGDLRITLISPDGRRAILQKDQPTLNAQSLVKTFSNSDTPAIGTLSGSSANGNWVLNVADVARLEYRDAPKLVLDGECLRSRQNANRSPLVSRVALSRSDLSRVGR